MKTFTGKFKSLQNDSNLKFVVSPTEHAGKIVELGDKVFKYPGQSFWVSIAKLIDENKEILITDWRDATKKEIESYLIKNNFQPFYSFQVALS